MRMKEFQPKSTLIEDNYGNNITEKHNILETWREYFSELLNYQTTDNQLSSEKIQFEC